MRLLIAGASLALALFACDDHDDHDHGGAPAIATSDLEIGCQHFEFGPFNEGFMAAADGAEAPMMMQHNHYAMAVPEAGGVAQFTPPSAGDYIFMFDTGAASLQVTDAAGNVITQGASQTPGDDCAAAAVALLYTLDAGAHTLRFEGATAIQAVIHGPIGGAHMHGEGGHDHGEGGHAHGEGGHGGDHMGEGGHGGDHMGEGGHGGDHMGEGGHGGDHMGEGGHGGDHMGEGGHGGDHMGEGGHGGDHMGEGGA